jgi:hypothetical protein
MTDDEMAAVKAAALTQLAALAPKAAEILIELLDSADSVVASAAALEVLGRGLPHALDAADADDDLGALDLRQLSFEDRHRLREALETVLVLIGPSRSRRQSAVRMN